jgi:hypothetical protein
MTIRSNKENSSPGRVSCSNSREGMDLREQLITSPEVFANLKSSHNVLQNPLIEGRATVNPLSIAPMGENPPENNLVD